MKELSLLLRLQSPGGEDLGKEALLAFCQLLPAGNPARGSATPVGGGEVKALPTQCLVLDGFRSETRICYHLSKIAYNL